MHKSPRRSSLGATAEPIATTSVDGAQYSVRLLSINDFRLWRSTRLGAEKFLAPAFGDHERSWAEQHSRADWLGWAEQLLARWRHREALPLVILRDSGGERELVGEIGLAGVDPVTRSGETYAWANRTPSGVAVWAYSNLISRLLGPQFGLERIVVPISSGNVGAERGMQALGFERKAVRQQLRHYAGVPTEHGLWVMENTPANRRAIEAAAY